MNNIILIIAFILINSCISEEHTSISDEDTTNSFEDIIFIRSSPDPCDYLQNPTQDDIKYFRYIGYVFDDFINTDLLDNKRIGQIISSFSKNHKIIYKIAGVDRYTGKINSGSFIYFYNKDTLYELTFCIPEEASLKPYHFGESTDPLSNLFDTIAINYNLEQVYKQKKFKIFQIVIDPKKYFRSYIGKDSSKSSKDDPLYQEYLKLLNK